jgi:hypothetical protein
MISGLVSEVALAESSFFYHDKSASILNAWEGRNQQEDDFELDKLLGGTTEPRAEELVESPTIPSADAPTPPIQPIRNVYQAEIDDDNKADDYMVQKPRRYIKIDHPDNKLSATLQVDDKPVYIWNSDDSAGGSVTATTTPSKRQNTARQYSTQGQTFNLKIEEPADNSRKHHYDRKPAIREVKPSNDNVIIIGDDGSVKVKKDGLIIKPDSYNDDVYFRANIGNNGLNITR